MNFLNFIKKHKFILCAVVAGIATLIYGDPTGMIFAIAPVVLADDPNPSDNMGTKGPDNPGGRPADDALQTDERGGQTQLQGKAATATDVRDAGLEAEDYDANVDNFRRFRFPIETYIANKCKPVKCDSYVHGHYRSGSTSLESIYGGNDITIKAKNNKIVVDRSGFDNIECLIECSTVIVEGVGGYSGSGSSEQPNGELMLYVLSNKDENEKISFLVINGSEKENITIPGGSNFFVAATACSESQIRVASETYLPERATVFLQKKNMTCIITDEFERQGKKVKHLTADVRANALYNYKRKCARSHWLSAPSRFDVKVKETGNREAVYTEKGILRQVPMLYTHDNVITDDDLMAISSLQFTDNSASDHAVAFCGKREMKRIMKAVNENSSRYRDASVVKVDKYGIRIRQWEDNFGTIDIIYDPTLDDIGYENYMVVLDLDNAVRYYKRKEVDINQDMSKTGENREAKAYNKSIIDCIALKGYNAVLVCPTSEINKAHKLGGLQASFKKIAKLPANGDLTASAKNYCYFLTEDDAGFSKGSLVVWDNDLGDWKEFEGLIKY